MNTPGQIGPLQRQGDEILLQMFGWAWLFTYAEKTNKLDLVDKWGGLDELPSKKSSPRAEVAEIARGGPCCSLLSHLKYFTKGRQHLHFI